MVTQLCVAAAIRDEVQFILLRESFDPLFVRNLVPSCPVILRLLLCWSFIHCPKKVT